MLLCRALGLSDSLSHGTDIFSLCPVLIWIQVFVSYVPTWAFAPFGVFSICGSWTRVAMVHWIFQGNPSLRLRSSLLSARGYIDGLREIMAVTSTLASDKTSCTSAQPYHSSSGFHSAHRQWALFLSAMGVLSFCLLVWSFLFQFRVSFRLLAGTLRCHDSCFQICYIIAAVFLFFRLFWVFLFFVFNGFPRFLWEFLSDCFDLGWLAFSAQWTPDPKPYSDLSNSKEREKTATSDETVTNQMRFTKRKSW